MAVDRTPVLKRCRQLGIDPVVMGINKTSHREPKRRRKESEYGMQLREKQKAKFIYGVLEKQFHGYYNAALKREGITGDNLMSILECRLDNVVYRMGLASSRKEARQMVRHAHFTLNGKKVDIPSIICKVGDVIALREKSKASEKFKMLVETSETAVIPKWLEIDHANATAKVIALPKRDDIDFPFEEQLIVELYSK